MKLEIGIEKENNKNADRKFSDTEPNNFCFMIMTNSNLLYTCIIGYFSYLFSTDPLYYGNELNCNLLRKWVYAFSWFCFIIILKEVLLLILSIFSYFKAITLNSYSLIVTQLLLFVISKVVSAILNIGMTIVLFKEEDCESFRTLAIFLVIFYWILIFIVFCLMVICCRYCGYSNIKNLILTTYNFKTNEQ